MEKLVRQCRHIVRFIPPCLLLTVISSCHSIGHSFKSDHATLNQLVIGETSPEDSVRILGGEPYMRTNSIDGTIVWTWQYIVAGAYVGVTDNKSLMLQFTTPDGGKTWRFHRVMHAQNIDLPEGMPFGTMVK